MKKRIRLFAAERRIADLVDDRQLRADHGAVEVLLEPILLAGGLELQQQVGGRDEMRLDAGLRRAISRRDRQLALADLAGSELDDVLGTPDEGARAGLPDPGARVTAGEAEVLIVGHVAHSAAGGEKIYLGTSLPPPLNAGLEWSFTCPGFGPEV